MEEIQEVEMTAERGDAVIDIGATRCTTEISEEENSDRIAIKGLVQQRLAAVRGEPFEFRIHTIPRLPFRFHEAGRTYYDPALVSIGPYHRGKGELRPMEEHKWSTLRDFLVRNDKVCFDDYFKEIRILEESARECYSETVNITSDEFVLMLILDACFILEYFLKLEYEQPDGFIYLKGWSVLGLMNDLLLLENQIPFIIIHKMFDVSVGDGQDCKDNCPLLKIIFRILMLGTAHVELKLPQEPCDTLHHLLHFYHACMVSEADLKMKQNNMVPNKSHSFGVETFSRTKSWFHRQSKKLKEVSADEKRVKEEESAQTEVSTEENMAKEEGYHHVRRYIIVPCVSELSEAGVTFKRRKEPRHMFDISFNNGVMEMPLMGIDSIIKIRLANIAAFEQSQVYLVSNTFTSYLALMDALINTEKDVTLLQQCGILDNLLQNEADAAAFYNRFGEFNGLDYEDHYFRDLFVKVRKYSDSTWHKYRGRLMRDYFSNPWTIISLVAAGFLLGLTVVQTYYAVYSSIHN